MTHEQARDLNDSDLSYWLKWYHKAMTHPMAATWAQEDHRRSYEFCRREMANRFER